MDYLLGSDGWVRGINYKLSRSELLRELLFNEPRLCRLWFSRHASKSKEDTLGEEGVYFWLRRLGSNQRPNG